MSNSQIQAASDFLTVLDEKDHYPASLNDNKNSFSKNPHSLNFINFKATGSATTYDKTSSAPDSASAATAIATGHKTISGTLNMDETGTQSFETITQKVHRQLGMKVGIISSVNLNHATPAAFYAHQAKRSNYYEIGLELVSSGFEYFAGGALRRSNGYDNVYPQKNLYELARNIGYTISFTNAEADSIHADSEKVILIDENLADSNTMSYEIDRTANMWSLANYVEKGIEILDNDKGFFLMCEGGKIDWACHANDAVTAIYETIALADAVQIAVDFANEYPNETLILVTGDHETGDLHIGTTEDNYNTYLSLLTNQKISFRKFDNEYTSNYKKNGTSFEEALSDIEILFGLKTKGTPQDKLVLTDDELEQLQAAFEKSMQDNESQNENQEEYLLYGSYNPLSVTLTHILNNKSGISFSSYEHTNLPVAVFAEGANADMFNGNYDNTDIFNKIENILNVK